MTNTDNNTEAKQIIAKYLKTFKVQCEEPRAYWVCVDTVERFLNVGKTGLAHFYANMYAQMIQMEMAG